LFVTYFSDVEIQAQFTLNQSRIEEITMKEDMVVSNLLGEDGFGDIPFDSEGEKEILRAGPAMEESIYNSKDASKITLNETDTGKGIADSTFERSKIGKNLHSFIHAFIHSFIHSFIHYIHSFIYFQIGFCLVIPQRCIFII